MALSVKHSFQSAKSDGLDTTKVRASNWNAEHTLTASVDSILGTTSASTSVNEIACTAAGRALLDDANAAAQKVTLSVSEIPLGGGFLWWSNSLPASNGSVVWGWANGQAISRTTFASLFALWGTAHGSGDGSTTFNVPDLRDAVPIGKRDMGGVAARGLVTNWTAGTLNGIVGSALHTLSTAELPAHNHGVNDSGHAHTGTTNSENTTHTHDTFVSLSGNTGAMSANASHDHSYNQTNNNNRAVSATGANTTVNADGGFASTTGATNTDHVHAWSGSGTFGSGGQSVNHQHTFTTNNNQTFISIQNTGSGSSHNNVQPSSVVNYVVRLA